MIYKVMLIMTLSGGRISYSKPATGFKTEVKEVLFMADSDDEAVMASVRWADRTFADAQELEKYLANAGEIAPASVTLDGVILNLFNVSKVSEDGKVSTGVQSFILTWNQIECISFSEKASRKCGINSELRVS
jgi:hypothetical protein